VFGLPRAIVKTCGKREWIVEMKGMESYYSVENATISSGSNKMAVYFLDADYDQQTFCICQTFFPDIGAWEKVAKVLQ